MGLTRRKMISPNEEQGKQIFSECHEKGVTFSAQLSSRSSSLSLLKDSIFQYFMGNCFCPVYNTLLIVAAARAWSECMSKQKRKNKNNRAEFAEVNERRVSDDRLRTKAAKMDDTGYELAMRRAKKEETG